MTSEDAGTAPVAADGPDAAGGEPAAWRVVIVRRAGFTITATSRSDAKKQMRRLRMEQPAGTRWVTIANTVTPQWVTERADGGGKLIAGRGKG